MRFLVIICLLILSSCQLRFVSPGYYNPNTTIVTAPVIPPPSYPWWSYRPYWWYQRPNYLGNVYSNHHHHYYNPPRTTYIPPRTNLPMNPYSGPRGGRRK